MAELQAPVNVGPSLKQDGNLDICNICGGQITLGIDLDERDQPVTKWIHTTKNPNERNRSVLAHLDYVEEHEGD